MKMPNTSYRFTDAILSRSMLTVDDRGDISLIDMNEIQTRLNSLHSTMTANEKNLSKRITDETASLSKQITKLSQQIDSLKTSKQDTGDYLRRGGWYQLQIRSTGGDNEMYSIDYWSRNGNQPGWVKNGRPDSCNHNGRPGHRCVVIG